MSSDPNEAARLLNDCRARVLAGEEVTPAEYRAIIDTMRTIRLAAAQSDLRRPRAAKKPAAPVNLDELM